MTDLTAAFSANQTEQKARSNNIINAQTPGYKEENVYFEALYNKGIGAGIRVDSVTHNMDKPGVQKSTGRALDLAIEGKGYFILAQGEGNLRYSRVGNFDVDREGNLIRQKSNLKVQGYSIGANGEVNTGTLNDIKISQARKPAKATDTLTSTGKLNRTKAAPSIAFNATDESSYSFKRPDTVFDSNGEKHDFFQYFVRDAADPKKWTVHYQLDNQGAGTANLAFDDNGKISPADFTATTNALTPDNAQPMTINIDYTNLTLSVEASNLGGSSANGYASSEYKGAKIDETGIVYAEYADGKPLKVGQIVLANFAAESELTSVDGTNLEHNNRSGEPILSTLDKNSTKQLKSGYLEGSNVDMQGELIAMIDTGMQAAALSSILRSIKENTETIMRAIG